MEIYRDMTNVLLHITQQGCIFKVLNMFNLRNSKSAITPIDARFKLSTEQSPKSENEVSIWYEENFILECHWQHNVWNGQYSPDIAYASSLICRYMSNPGGMIIFWYEHLS